MYPSAIILTIAAFRRDVYHYLVERLPDVFENSEVCKLGIPCSQIWFERFGFVTLPLMALVGFAATASLLTMPKTTPAAPQEELT